MSGVLLAGLCLLQASGVEVTAAVDRARLTVGEELTLTLRVRAQTPAVPRLELPALAGFAVVGSRELSEVSLEGMEGMSRITVRALTLRAEHAGSLTIGKVRARVGEMEAATEPIAIRVDSATAFPETALNALARTLLASASPPARSDQVALTVVVPTEPTLVGHQLDLVVAAWFPRSLAERLRRPPLLTLQTPEDVWAYPPSAPSSVALSRQVRGQWMDVYAVHQVLFPLAAGRIVVPPASVDYAVPMNFSFFSTEERYSLSTDSVAIAVLPLPTSGRPADDQGVVAQDLQLDVSISPAEVRVGEPLEVATTLRGIGNVSLWPVPALVWPAGFRSYPEETTVRIESANGRVAGTKTFHSLVVADSAGSFLLPAVRYPYYDLGARAYRISAVAARSLVAAQGAEPRAARALPPLLGPRSPDWSDQVSAALTPWGWLGIAVLPPLGVLYQRRRRRASPAAAPRPGSADLTPLGQLEREFLASLTTHVADAALRDTEDLARALRAAGLDRAVADHVARLRDRLRAIRYGPRGSGDALALASELQRLMRVFESDSRPGRRRVVTASVGVLALVLVSGTRLRATQTPTAEALYRAGALRAAADSFAARAAADSLNPAPWYDLGATLYRSGADGKAIAAWTIAQRLAPRDDVIRRARRLLPPRDPVSEELLAVGLATPGEWAILAAASWIVAWLLGLWRRPAVAAAVATLTVVAGVMGQVERHRRERPVVVVVTPGTPLRAAPYGSASASLTLEPGTAALVAEEFAGGRWLLVRRPDGITGWVLAGHVVRL